MSSAPEGKRLGFVTMTNFFRCSEKFFANVLEYFTDSE